MSTAVSLGSLSALASQLLSGAGLHRSISQCLSCAALERTWEPPRTSVRSLRNQPASAPAVLPGAFHAQPWEGW